MLSAYHRIDAIRPEQNAGISRHRFGRIPVIEHDGFWLYEAAAINPYMDQVFPGPSLVPADPKAQARMNQVMGIVDWYVMPTISTADLMLMIPDAA